MNLDLVPQEFDRTDLKNLGRPSFFNVDMYLSLVEQMITCDEVEKALWMLDNMPGWYRDNLPVRAIQIKERLYKQFYTPITYAKESSEEQISMFALGEESAVKGVFLEIDRFKKIHDLCLDLNQKGIIPHIIELSPGTYMLPFGLKACGINFTYFGEGLNDSDDRRAARYLPGIWHEGKDAKTNIFICLEVIEHLSNPTDIYHYAVKQGIKFDYICLSTPLYTWSGGMPDWYNKDLGHLRTYTPNEFVEFGVKHWRGYGWELGVGSEMFLKGKINS